MKNRYILIVGILFLLIIGSFFLIHHFNNKYHEDVKQHPQKYCFQLYLGAPNPILIVETEKYQQPLIDYYNKREKDPLSNPGLGVPLKTLSMYDPVYVMGYTKDSLLADIVSYKDRGRLGGGSYLRGWVYAKLLHDNPPPKVK